MTIYRLVFPLFPVIGLLCAVLPVSSVSARPDLDRLIFFPQPIPDLESRLSATDSVDSEFPDLADTEWYGTGQGIELSIAHYEQEVARIQSSRGPFAEELSEQYMAMASLMQQHGDLPAALEAAGHALQILRVNHGLLSLAQIPVLKSMINTYVEMGDLVNADSMQESLLNLQLKFHGANNLDAVSPLLDWADWNVNLYLAATSDLADLLVPGGARPGSSQFNDPRIFLAYENYSKALELLQEKSAVSDERLVATEKKLAALNFIVNREIREALVSTPVSAGLNAGNLYPDELLDQVNTAHFFNGSSALKRAIVYSYNSPQPDYDYIAEQMMELGDWYLLFDRKAAALEIYRNALEVLAAANTPEQEKSRILAQGLPVKTPVEAYLRPPATEEFDGYIDVEFELNRYGSASNPRIISSTEPDQRIEKELLRTIRGCKFRPLFAESGTPESERVKLRYYYTL